MAVVAGFMTEKRLVGLLALFCVALWSTRLTAPLDVRWDGGLYYTVGTSLAQGRGYRILYEPGQIQAVQYPPALPAVVAAHQLVLKSSDPWLIGRALTLTFFLLYVCCVVGIYFLARVYCAPIVSFLAALLYILHVHSFFMANTCFAELPFTLMTVLFVLAARKRECRWCRVAAAALAMVSYLARTAGLAFLAAWVGEAVLKRQVRQVLSRGALALVPILAWNLYVRRVLQGEEYRSPAYEYQRADYLYYNVPYEQNASLYDPFKPERGRNSPARVVTRFLVNMRELLFGTAQTVTTRMDVVHSPKWRVLLKAVGLFPLLGDVEVEAPFHFAMTVLILAGLVCMAVKGDLMIPLYVVASLALVCLTPWPSQFKRYVVPIVPFCIVAMFALVETWRRGQFPRGKAISTKTAAVIIGLILIFIVPADTFMYGKLFGKFNNRVTVSFAGKPEHTFRLFYFDPGWETFDVAVDWLGANARPDDIVVCSAPYWVYFRTGLRSVMPPFEPDREEANRLMEAVPAKYVIIDGLYFQDVCRRYARPAIQRYRERWDLVFTNRSLYGRVEIYRRRDVPGGEQHHQPEQ